MIQDESFAVPLGNLALAATIGGVRCFAVADFVPALDGAEVDGLERSFGFRGVLLELDRTDDFGSTSPDGVRKVRRICST